MPIKQLLRRLHGDAAIKTINNLNQLEKKYIQSSNHVTFLMRCRDKEIIPKGLKLNSPVNSAAARAILHTASKRLVTERIRHHRKTKAITFSHIDHHLQQLNSTLSPAHYSSLRSAQNQANNKLDSKIKTKQLNKLRQLQNNKPNNTKSRGPSAVYEQYIRKTVVNLSSKTITKDQINVLAKGLTYAPTMTRRNHDDFISNIEKGLQQLAPGGKVDYLRHQICHILQKAKPQTPNLTRAEKQTIKNLKEDPDITIAAADKGRATVILDRPEFHSLVNKMLADSTTYRKLKKDPTSRLERQHKSTLNHLKDTFQLTTEQYRKLSISHPQPPYARATIKIHKDPIKARLLICSKDTVYYSTAQHLTRILSPLGKTANSYIADSRDFCQKIQTITQPDQIISYDVVDLFTNVPTNEALQILHQRISDLDQPLDTNLSIDSIINLTKSCITSTYFTWGNDTYEQIHGLPMGSPLSPILTEIYMTHFEEQALSTSPIQPVCWYRKVDDTFVILKEDQDPTSLLEHLNNQHPRVKFTMETENNQQLPFLDVLVSRDSSNKIQTTVYRKPTHSDQYIHFKSNHPPKTKSGIISTLTKRAKNICSTDLDDELNHLQHVFTNLNQYPTKLVNKTISSTLQPQPKPIRPETAPIRITLPYIGKTTHQISRLLKHQAGIDTIFTGSPSLRTILQANGRNPPSKTQPPKGTIYKINCDCGDSYIGETSRPVDIRIKEHKSSTAKADSKSALSDHQQQFPSHHIQWEKVEILSTKHQDFTKRKLSEAIQIRRHKPLINRDQGYYIPSAYEDLIKQ